ncbi:unnamed protein product [Clonostachys rosea]|uniref:Uncharacterized protein n=1 Tax=Bionectria ochroleuca TaxID=29856 RepID=A0ABY6U9P1_BIOOC|nr:unnamed protein product [Clonostachys rosea]
MARSKERTTSRDTLSLGTGVVGTAGVTGLGADTGLGETGDTTLGVADGDAKSANGTAVDTSGRAGAADAGSNGRGGATRHGEATAAVVVDVAPEGGSADSADVAHVGATREDGTREGSQGLTTGGGGRSADAAAVTSGNKASGDGKANRATSASVDVVSVTALDRGESCRERVNDADFKLRLGESNLCGQLGGMGGADELVGHNVHVVRGNARLGRGVVNAGLFNVQVVKRQLGLFKLGEAVGQDDRNGTSRSNLRSQGFVSDTDVDGVSVVGDPSTGELRTNGVAQLVNDIGSLDLPGDTSSGLLGIHAQVPLHGSQDLRVQPCHSLGRSTVGKGQDNCQDGKEPSELHV